jgi:hypothetical protein
MAQQTDRNDIRLSVSAMNGVLGPGSVDRPEQGDRNPQTMTAAPTTLNLRVLVENRSERDVQALRLVTEIYPAVRSRSALRQALDGTLTTDPIVIRDPAVTDGRPLRGGEVTGIAQSFEQSDVAWANGGGVHPIRLSVTRGTQVLDEVLTAVVWLQQHPDTPLHAVMVWPLAGAPWRMAGGEYDAAGGHGIRPGERLDELVRALELTPTAPVVLAPAPHLLEDLRDRGRGVTVRERLDGGNVETRDVEADDVEARLANGAHRRIREVAGSLPFAPVSGTYASADLSALHASGSPALRDLASETAAMARQRLYLEIDRAPDGAVHLLAGAVTPPVLDLLSGDQLLVPYDATDKPDPANNPPLGLPVHRLQSPAGRALTAMVADPYLTELLSRPDATAGPLVAVQRIVAETALIHFEAPNASGRSVLLMPELNWDPGLDVAAQLLDELQTADWLELTSPGQAITEGRRATASLGFSTPDPGDFPPAFAADLDRALTELDAAETSMAEGETTIGGRLPTDLADDLARSSSSWLRSDGQVAAEPLVRDVRSAVSELFGEIRVSDASVTLTSDSGQVPVTLQRTRGGPIDLQIEVVSQGRLTWPDGRHSAILTLDEDSSTTVSFATEALSTGTFPVTVLVTDPSGTVEIERTTLTVRSTAISGPALAGISSVVVILLLIGGLRRRHDPPALKIVSETNGRASGREAPYSAPGEGRGER